MINALWITAIGMGLVFLAILVLWGLMALLVRITDQPEETEADAADETAADAAAVAVAPEAAPDGALDRKRRAAAAAVAVALSLRKPVRLDSVQRAGSVSAWQAVNRASQVSQRAYSSRKKVLR